MDIQSKINNLAKMYNYKKLPDELSRLVRKDYFDHINELGMYINGSHKDVFSKSGVLISHGYLRIVIGDYGPYIEMSQDQVIEENFIIPPRQKFRLLPRYLKNEKYLWYSIPDGSVKLYKQLRGVSYADYKSGMWYISPDEVKIQ